MPDLLKSRQVEQHQGHKITPKIVPVTARFDPHILSLIQGLLDDYKAGELLGLFLIKKTLDDTQSGWIWNPNMELFYDLHKAAGEVMYGYEEEE